MDNINWYPGHMKKTRTLIQENLKMVDAVIEVLDARIPLSSRNPVISELAGGKRRLVVLNKSDLSDAEMNRRWEEAFREEGFDTVSMNCMQGKGLKRIFAALEKNEQEINSSRSVARPFRVMIAGVPNVGKSSLINRLTGRKSTQTGNKPGVTRGKQWLKMKNGMQLLDTPGILWPKFEDRSTGLNLAFCGSIKDEILDLPSLALELITELSEDYPEMLAKRYKLDGLSDVPLENMENMAAKRGCLMSGGRTDYERIAKIVLDEFRAGKIGQITLERPEDAGKAGSDD